MQKIKHFILVLIVTFFTQAAYSQNNELKMGADNVSDYLPLLEGKSVGLVVNQTSLINNKTHLVDSLLSRGVNIKVIFAPEHGFRGDHSAGAHVNSGKDEKTNLPIISLYGDHKKPTKSDLKGVDVVIFDIQDVGVRFYTYISTMHYVMEACAEYKKQFIVFDRPNPNIHCVDGPILDMKYKSFVGMHPLPLCHGMTVGELAQMINGEGWLAEGVKCDLTIVTVRNYHRQVQYELPVRPSPNLGSIEAIYLYPSLGLFEGTIMSIGRGTDHPFECLGAPFLKEGTYTFTPKTLAGIAEHPKYEGQECRGFFLKEFAKSFVLTSGEIYLYWLKLCYDNAPDKTTFFTSFFDKLAGTDTLRKQIVAGKTPEEIHASWQPDLRTFKEKRKKYLLYN